MLSTLFWLRQRTFPRCTLGTLSRASSPAGCAVGRTRRSLGAGTGSPALLLAADAVPVGALAFLPFPLSPVQGLFM